MHTDGAKDLSLSRWKDVQDIYVGIKQTNTKPYSLWQNRAEAGIRELKKHVARQMQRTYPKQLWDYCSCHTVEIRSRMAQSLPKAKGRTPLETLTGNTPDISEYTDFAWYDWCWYLDTDADFSEGPRKMARWLGVAHCIGQALCYYIITARGQVLARTTVQPFTNEEMRSPDNKLKMKEFDMKLNTSIRNDEFVIHDGAEPGRLLDELDDELDQFTPYEPEAEMPEADDFDDESFDEYLSARIILPKGDKYEKATVVRRKRDIHGNPMGKSDTNPKMDTRMYEVQFSDGTVQEYTVNLIAESIYSQVDSEGKEHLILDEIESHRSDDSAVTKDDSNTGCVVNCPKGPPTTRGWKFLVKWKDNTTSWVSLKDLKVSDPIKVAEYTINNKIDDQPAFSWWVHDVLNKHQRIINKIKTKYWKRTRKYGVEMPKSIAEAFALDARNGNNLWRKAIEK